VRQVHDLWALRVLSDVRYNIFIRAVCGKESSVMFIEGVPDCLCCEAIEETKVSAAAPLIDIYSQQEANLFSIAKASQVTMATMPPKL